MPLLITRRKDQGLRIDFPPGLGQQAIIYVEKIGSNWVRLGVEAPSDIHVDRIECPPTTDGSPRGSESDHS